MFTFWNFQGKLSNTKRKGCQTFRFVCIRQETQLKSLVPERNYMKIKARENYRKHSFSAWVDSQVEFI